MNRADIQGLLFSGYSAQPASALLRIQFASGFPNAWLRRTLPQISSGATSERSDPCRVNLAFTFVGLEKLGLPPASLAEFSHEFRQGMAHPERAAVLGDLVEERAAMTAATGALQAASFPRRPNGSARNSAASCGLLPSRAW